MEEQFPEGESTRQAAGGLDRVNPLAAGVLRRNGIKSWTKPAPTLYPHQWSWDSAFIALGLAHVDNRRARDELESLFAGQWATGKVPHIVFNPEAPPKSYFPDAERWNSSALSADAPTGSHTSGLCQPPVHAIAVRRIWETSRGKEEERVERARRFLKANYPRLFAWHRYLATARDPEGPHHRLGRVRPARLRRDSTRGRLHAAGGAPSAGCARGPEDGRFARVAAGARSPARPARGGGQTGVRRGRHRRRPHARPARHRIRSGHHSRRWLA
jgi:hypothetical protein